MDALGPTSRLHTGHKRVSGCPSLYREVCEICGICRVRTPRIGEEYPDKAPEGGIATLLIHTFRGLLLHLCIREFGDGVMPIGNHQCVAERSLELRRISLEEDAAVR